MCSHVDRRGRIGHGRGESQLSPGLRALIVWPIFAAWVIGVFLLADLPYSAFYVLPLGEMERDAAERRLDAEQYFKSNVTRLQARIRSATLLDGTPRRDPQYVDVCIAVLRSKRKYFLPTMHSLLTAMTPSERDSACRSGRHLPGSRQ